VHVIVRADAINTHIFQKMSTMNNNRQQILIKAAEAHRETLRKNVQRRLETARARGDEALIRQLEAEVQYIG